MKLILPYSFLFFSSSLLLTKDACEVKNQFSDFKLIMNVQEANECPKPTRSEFEYVCYQIKQREPSNIKIKGLKWGTYTYHESLWEMSCVDPNKDSFEVVKVKVQQMWNKHREDFYSYFDPTSDAAGLNVAKWSVGWGGSLFIRDMIRRYELDFNFIDPKDGKTIIDYLKNRVSYIREDIYATANDKDIIGNEIKDENDEFLMDWPIDKLKTKIVNGIEEEDSYGDEDGDGRITGKDYYQDNEDDAIRSMKYKVQEYKKLYKLLREKGVKHAREF